MSLLKKDDPDFSETKRYLKPYIEDVLAHFSMPEKTYRTLYNNLMNDIPVAARRFLEDNQTKPKYKFSTYFGWYISKRLNNTGEEVKRLN